MFRGEHTGVEKDHDDDEPVERLRLDETSTRLATMTIRHVHRPPNNRYTITSSTHGGHTETGDMVVKILVLE